MFGSTRYPFNFANRNGIPLVEVNSVTVGTESVVLNLPNRSFRWLSNKGVILLRLTSAIPEGTTATLPIVFSANNQTQALINVGGTPITVAQLPGAGVYMIYYDKDANLMQLLTTQIA